MKFELDTTPSEESINKIRDGLASYNSSFLGNVSKESVAYYVTIDGNKVAGIVAEICGTWLSR